MRKPYEIKISQRAQCATQATLELGCGHGHFLVSQALAEPEKYYIGVDCLSKRLDKARLKAEKAHCAAVEFIEANAFDFLEMTPKALRWEAVFVLFSDPWPKRRHHKNRLIQPRLLDLLHPQMVDHAPLYFRTDHTAYFEDSLRLLASRSDFFIDTLLPWPEGSITVFQGFATAFQSVIIRKK